MRIIKLLQRIIELVIDRIRYNVYVINEDDISNEEGTHNFKPVGVRSIVLDSKNVVIDLVIDTCSQEAAIL